jgi:hypothetical protein
VAVEKLIPAKIAEMKLLQDAIISDHLGSRDISIPQILTVSSEKRVFQHPRVFAITVELRP